jgi:phage shock protein A
MPSTSALRLPLIACGALGASAFSLGGAPQLADPRLSHTCRRHPLQAHRLSPSPISMNLGERFVRLVKSNVNSVIGNLEDPEKVLEQAVADMQKDLIKVRQAYAEVSASTKRMQEQIKLADAEGAKWYDRAQLALSKGEDELAREALTRRKQQLEMGDSLREQVEGQEASITSLYESMKELEAKMAEAKAKKDQIIARARTAKAATKVNDMLAGVGTSSSMAAFDRMSDKVGQLEAEADVSKQLAASSSSGAGSSIDQQFKALESADDIDDELAAMKKEQGLLGPSAVDDELEAMKKMLEDEKKD